MYNHSELLFIDSHGDLYNLETPGWPVEGLTLYYLPFGVVLIGLI